MNKNHLTIKQETTPILRDECFILFERDKEIFDFPIHFHSEYELNCMIGAKGCIRTVGDSNFETSDYELLLTGPNVIHGWTNNNNEKLNIKEKTLQFQNDLFSNQLLNKNLLLDIKQLLTDSHQGISFSINVCKEIFELLPNLKILKGIDAYIELIRILEILTKDNNRKILTPYISSENIIENSAISEIYNYVQTNYHKKIELQDVAESFNMSISTFNRFVKRKTGNSFIDFLIDFRLGMAARKLKESDLPISSIAENCGFNNISNFNRLFKKHYKVSPKKFRTGIEKVLTG